MRDKISVSFSLNGRRVEVETNPNITLLDLLRRKFRITSVKRGCERGECGVCTVLINGRPMRSCLLLVPQVQGKQVITVDFLAHEGVLHPIQEAFIETGAVQCGFCTPAMILTTKALLDVNKEPSDEEIRKAISGVLCRCTGYVKIVEAVKLSARKLSSTDLG
ncbi:MAG TPA: (2Fe-2S)-binding protein [Candidatus Korarchaeota archaeon]|nr:(2Fe-2S)-binding protein [Candidatus Korarchaeota archaeon]